MSVIINFKICDNAKECGRIEVCPVNAIYWNEEKEIIETNNDKCVNCSKCINACPVGAIKVAKNQKEFEEIKRKIDEDTRKPSELFVDRYGAVPIFKKILKDKSEIKDFLVNQEGLVIMELFDDSSINCLLKSIPVNELFKNEILSYIKIETDDNLLSEYEIEELPALTVFKDGNFIGKIEGYFDETQKEELINKIQKIIY